MTETQRNEQNEVTNLRNSSLYPVELNMSWEEYIYLETAAYRPCIGMTIKSSH